MEISNAHYQAMSSHPLDEVLSGCPKAQQQQQEKKPRPQPEHALKCPRCDSTNTKFCYYNNYSLSQPRYFCKGCRRYWTQGGSLRNVPVGGGCRRNKRSSSSSSSKKAGPDHHQGLSTHSPNPLLPTLPYDPSDLTLAFARLHNQQPTARQLGLQDDHHDPFLLPNPNSNPSHHLQLSADPGFIDILRNGFLATNPNGFHQNLYYGFGGPGSSVEEMEGGVGSHEVMLPIEQGLQDGATAASTPTTTCNKLMDGEESKVMMGVQWQLANAGEGNINSNIAFDSGREYLWTGVGSPWHGLINSTPLL